MKYDLKKPCRDCPFIKSTNFKFTRAKAHGIATQNGGFPCHKTAKQKRGSFQAERDSQACAGRLIMLERDNQPDQMMRIAERIGLYDRTKLDMKHPDVFDSIGDFMEARVD